jgi:hypothetical protein
MITITRRVPIRHWLPSAVAVLLIPAGAALTATPASATPTHLAPISVSTAGAALTATPASATPTHLAPISVSTISYERGPGGALVEMRVIRGRHGSVTSHWWGLSIYMDAFLTNKVIAAVGAATVAGLVLQGLGEIAWPLAVAIAAAAPYIGFCQHQDGSVTFDFISGSSIPVCS